jgi:hypothetical protein
MLSVCHLIKEKTMATKNPRVVGYIQPETHAKLKQFMEEHNVSESKALDLILGEHFGVEVPRVTLSITPDIDSRIDEAIAPIRQELAELKAAIEQQQRGKCKKVA